MLTRRLGRLSVLFYRHIGHKGLLGPTIKDIILEKPVGENLVVQGWVQAFRRHKNLCFVDVVDGSCFNRLQVVLEGDQERFPSYGSSIQAEGELVESKHKGQDVELICKVWKTLGTCPEDYPFHNRLKYSSEYIRSFPHLRPRTKTCRSVLRLRSFASQAIHDFFQQHGFYFVHTPVFTLNDCEGAGEVFTIKPSKAFQEDVDVDQKDCTETSLSSSTLGDEGGPEHNLLSSTVKEEPMKEEFFGAPAYLTVSAQLHLEAVACALSRVYTFGPVFRAENSRSRQHASEFHMIEAEMAFCSSLEDIIKVVRHVMRQKAFHLEYKGVICTFSKKSGKCFAHIPTDVASTLHFPFCFRYAGYSYLLYLCAYEITEHIIKFIAQKLVENCSDEIAWINEKYSVEKEYTTKLLQKSFPIMTYADAVEILQSKYRSDIKWGDDLSLENKNLLLKHCDDTPVVVTMFPSAIKPFYMMDDKHGKAYCFDVLAHFGGEICGGSLREHSLEKLAKKLENRENLAWYLDLRRYGSVPHGGFGIGFDRMLQAMLGIPNIRDIIPFPRRKRDCKC